MIPVAQRPHKGPRTGRQEGQSQRREATTEAGHRARLEDAPLLALQDEEGRARERRPPWKLEGVKTHTYGAQGLQKDLGPANSVILGLLPSRTERSKIYAVLATVLEVICYTAAGNSGQFTLEPGPGCGRHWAVRLASASLRARAELYHRPVSLPLDAEDSVYEDWGSGLGWTRCSEAENTEIKQRDHFSPHSTPPKVTHKKTKKLQSLLHFADLERLLMFFKVSWAQFLSPLPPGGDIFYFFSQH